MAGQTNNKFVVEAHQATIIEKRPRVEVDTLHQHLHHQFTIQKMLEIT